MEILINELSLDSQFKTKDDFLDNIDNLLHIIKLIETLRFSLLKSYTFFDSKITATETFLNIAQSRDDRVRKLKSFLLKLSNNPPYWNETQKHCANDKYFLNDICIFNTSLAESCERDRVILSFTHSDFLDKNLVVNKNNEYIDIYNIISRDYFLEYLLSISKIEPLYYCQLKFKKSNLNFDQIEYGYGFNLLKIPQQQNEFIESFRQFSQMCWRDIINSDGLQYKKYNGTEFEYDNIYKFRVTQKYRCFGYREGDTFFVLRFEIDHRISDNG